MTLISTRPSTIVLLDKIGAYSHDFSASGLALTGLFHGLWRTGDAPKTTTTQSPVALVINWIGQEVLQGTNCTLEVRDDNRSAQQRSTGGLPFVFRVTNGRGLGLTRNILLGGPDADITALRCGPYGASNAAAWSDFIESIESVAIALATSCKPITLADGEYAAFYMQLSAMKASGLEHLPDDRGYQLAVAQMELFLDNQRLKTLPE